MSEENKKEKKIHYVLLGLLLFLIAVIRGVEYLINQEVLKLDENMSFNKFIFQTAESMTKSWIPFTIILLVLFISYVFRQIYNREKISGKYITALLLAANLLLIGKWYQSESVSRNLEQLKTKWYLFAGLIVLTVVGYFALDIIKDNSVKKKIRNDLIDQAINNPSNLDVKNYRDELIKKENSKNAIKTAKINYKLKKIDAKTNRKIESINKEEPMPNTGFATIIIAFFLFLLSLCVIICYGIYTGDNPIDYLIDFLRKIFEKLQEIININEGLSSALTIFLLGIGVVFSFVIVACFITFTVYFILQLIIYFFYNTKEDYRPIKHFAQEFKVFFFDTAEDVMTLLLFIPSFLSETLYFLFGENHIRGRIRHTLGSKEDIEESKCKRD